MKKPVFADIAALVGGLIDSDEKKKKRGAKPLKEAKGLKRRTAASKYDVIGVQKLVKALPARPARLPVMLVPGAPRAAPAPAPLKGRHRRTHLEMVRDESLSKLAAVNVVQTKRRQAAAELLNAETDFYDPNKGRLTDFKQQRITAAYHAAKENDAKRARELGDALAASAAAKEVQAAEQARVGIRAEKPEPEEVFADSTPAKRVKTPKKSLEAVFEEAAKTKASEKQAKAEARAAKAEAKAADNAAKAEARAELKAADKAELKAKAAPAKAAPQPPKGLVKFQKLVKAQNAANAEAEKGRAKYYELAGLAAPLSRAEESVTPKTRGKKIPPPPPGYPPGDPRSPVVGTGRFLGRIYR